MGLSGNPRGRRKAGNSRDEKDIGDLPPRKKKNGTDGRNVNNVAEASIFFLNAAKMPRLR